MLHRRVVCLIVVLIALLGVASPASAQGPDASDEIFYQFMPIAWRASEARCRAAAEGSDAREVKYRFGDFAGMTESLDYLGRLGITAVWMTPVFPSPAYHGYQHMAADAVNPWFGTEEEFIAFVKAAHARKIKVFIDIVAYGIGRGSEYYTSAHLNPSSPYASWLAFTDDAKDKSHGYDFKTWDGTTLGITFWDLRRQEPRDLVAAWSKKWLDPNGDGDFSDGVDGYRLDHVWARYPNGPDGWGYHIDSFWVPWKQALRDVNPNVYTFAEQARWETTGADLLPAHDAAFAKPFEGAAREALKAGKAAPLYNAMRQAVGAIPASRALGNSFLAILGDHDVDRLASDLGTDDAGRAEVAAAVLLLQPFPPVIYMGDELGMLGKAGNFGSDANDIPRREPFKWKAVAGPPMSDYDEINEGAYRARHSKDRDGRSVEEQAGNPSSLLEQYRRLIGVRAANIALRRGEYVPIESHHPGVWAFARVHKDQTLVVAINLSAEVAPIRLDLTPLNRIGPVREILRGQPGSPVTGANAAQFAIRMPPLAPVVLSIEERPRVQPDAPDESPPTP